MQSFSKASMMLGGGPPVYKQLKTAMTEGNEDKAITLYMSKEGSKLHPSKAFPSKKVGGSEDTPMHVAARHALGKMFKMFIEYGGHPGCINARKENCAHAVCQLTSFPAKRAEILEMIYDWRGQTVDNLIDLVDIDYTDIEGNTALHVAAMNGILPCVEFLVARGANIAQLNNEGLTCSDLADRGGHFALGTVLELGKVFTPTDEAKEASNMYLKFTTELPDPKLVPDSHSISLPGLIDFMNEAIKTTSERLNETAARAEVLLNTTGWDFRHLNKEFQANPDVALNMAHIRPRVEDDCKGGKPEINVGIPVEEIYFDPCYNNVPSFTIYIDGKKKVYNFQNYDGKVGVFPVDYDPSFKYLDSNQTFSETSHVKPKKTDPCPMCGKLMFEPTSIQHFLAGTLVEPLHRELHCSSGHKFCFSCWSDHAQLQLKRDNAIGCLPCPAAGCGEILDLQWAPVILKKADMVNRLIAQRQKHVIDALGLRWCPIPNCGLLVNVPEITDEEYLQLDATQRAARVGICANGHASCMECNGQAHTPCSCSQLVTWSNLLRDELTALSPNEEPTSLLSMVKHYPSARKCPKCPTGMIQKSIGCNITPCNACHVQVCYTCLEEWNQHMITPTGTVYCNRYGSKFNHYARGHDEEKQDHSHSHKQRTRHAKIAHYAHRFKVHEESWFLEQQVRHVTIERVHEALKLSHEGELKWIHGTNAINPYAEKALEMGAENMLMTKFEEKDCDVEKFYFKAYPAVDFIAHAFEELERDRLFLRWSYPFVFLEFEDSTNANNQQTNHAHAKQGRSGNSVVSGAGVVPTDNRNEFLNLQATFEYFTEILSYLISRNRLRATKEEIEKATRDARAKRIEMEEFVIQYYLTRRPEAQLERIPSTTSSLTSRSSIEDEDEDGEDEEEEAEEPVLLVPAPVQTADFEISDDDDEEPVPTPEPPPEPADNQRTSRAFTRIDHSVQVQQTETVETMEQQQSLFRTGANLVHHSGENSAENSVYHRRIQSQHQRYQPPPPPPPPQRQFIPPPMPPPQPIIEQRLIGAKKDPDQEALEHAILISKQEEEFGVNMYDALLDEDEPIVEEYMAQGFTREEAILIIFEERFGKVSIYQQSRITPAMPTLHKLDGPAQEVDPADEPEIEFLMTKGYTREQAIEVMFTQRRKAEERRQEEERRRQRELERQYFPQTTRQHNSQDYYLETNSYHEPAYVYDAAPSTSNTGSRRGSSTHHTTMHTTTNNIINYEDDEEMQELLRLGYTREQAMAVVMAHRMADDDQEPPTAAPVESDVIENAGFEDEYMEENAEVAYLMSRGYTREQAIQVAETNQRTRNAASATATSSHAHINTNSNMGSLGHVSNDRELEQMMSQGYTREQATQMLLLRSSGATTNNNSNNRRATTTATTSMDYEDSSALYGSSSSVNNNNNPTGAGRSSSVYRASALMDQFSASTDDVANNNVHSGNTHRSSTYTIGGGASSGVGGSSHAQTSHLYDANNGFGDGMTSYYESTLTSSDGLGLYGSAHSGTHTSGLSHGGGGTSSYLQPPPPRGMHTLSPEEEEMERVILISQQEAEFGVNMYDSITPADGPEVENMIAMGYSEFEALQWIFDRRFRHNPGQLQLQQQHQQQQQQQQQQQLQQQQLMFQQQQQEQMEQQLLQQQQQQLLFQQQQQQYQQEQLMQQQQQSQYGGYAEDYYGNVNGNSMMMMPTSFMMPQQQPPPQDGGQAGYRRFTSSVYRADADGNPIDDEEFYYDDDDEYQNSNGHRLGGRRSSMSGGARKGHRRNSSFGGGMSVSGNTVNTMGRQSVGGNLPHRSSMGGNGSSNQKTHKKIFRGASLVGLPAHVDEAAEAQGVNSTSLHRLEKAFKNVKRSDIIKALKRAGGDVDEAAIILSSYG